jgi:hypothetical protein
VVENLGINDKQAVDDEGDHSRPVDKFSTGGVEKSEGREIPCG